MCESKSAIKRCFVVVSGPIKAKIVSAELFKNENDRLNYTVALTIEYNPGSIQTHLIIGCLSKIDIRCNSADTQSWIYLDPKNFGGTHFF